MVPLVYHERCPMKGKVNTPKEHLPLRVSNRGMQKRNQQRNRLSQNGLSQRHRWNVVATLVSEEDVWQFETTETCTTETQMQDRRQESIAVVDYEDRSATETI